MTHRQRLCSVNSRKQETAGLGETHGRASSPVPSNGARTRPQQSPRWECTVQVPLALLGQNQSGFSTTSDRGLDCRAARPAPWVPTTQDCRDPTEVYERSPASRCARVGRSRSPTRDTGHGGDQPTRELRQRLGAKPSPPYPLSPAPNPIRLANCRDSLPCESPLPAARLQQQPRS
jgi:hypothetical protein